MSKSRANLRCVRKERSETRKSSRFILNIRDTGSSCRNFRRKPQRHPSLSACSPRDNYRRKSFFSTSKSIDSLRETPRSAFVLSGHSWSAMDVSRRRKRLESLRSDADLALEALKSNESVSSRSNSEWRSLIRETISKTSNFWTTCSNSTQLQLKSWQIAKN